MLSPRFDWGDAAGPQVEGQQEEQEERHPWSLILLGINSPARSANTCHSQGKCCHRSGGRDGRPISAALTYSLSPFRSRS